MIHRKPEEQRLPPDDGDSVSLTSELATTRSDANAPVFNPFESLNDEILGLIRSNMSEVGFRPGEVLIRQGEPGTSLMVVAEGELEVTVEKDGVHYRIKRVGAKEILGEMALLTKQPRMATVTALSAGRVLVMPAERFDELAASHPRISVLLTLLLASRLGTVAHDAMTGNTFHGYRVRRCVGHGGMSVVYEAEEVRTGRRVALKMMSHRLLYDAPARELFRHEADVVEAFHHPNISRMYGRFEAFRTSFIVMEFCEGRSISHATTRGGPFPETVVRQVIGQTASAIGYAHERGVVHRDVKPSNLMVTRDGTVKLIDFGLAGELDKESLAPALFGTPQYMAPEQMTGGPAGKEIDLFALGHVAFEMLAGRRLFTSREFRALKSEMAKWRTPDLPAVLPGVSPELLGVLRELLTREPERRRLDFDRVTSWAAPVVDGRLTGH